MRNFYLPIIRANVFTNILRISLIIFCIGLINLWYVKSDSIWYIQKQNYISTWSEENWIFSYTFNWDRTSFSVSDYCTITWVRTKTNENDTIFDQNSRGGGAYRSQVTIRYWENPDDIVPVICFYSSMYWYNAIYRSQDIGAGQRNLTDRNEDVFDWSDNMILTWNCNWWWGNRIYHMPDYSNPSIWNLYSVGDHSLSCNLIFKESWEHTITIEDPLYRNHSPNSWQITQIKVWLSWTFYAPIKNDNWVTISHYPDIDNPTLYDNNHNAETITMNWLPQLKILDLSNNKITSTSFLRSAQHVDSLEYLDLTNNPITSTSEQFYVKIQENTILTPSKDFKRFWYSYKETSPKYKRELKNNYNEIIRSWITTGTNGRNKINNINIWNDFQWKFRVSILNNNNEAAYDEATIGIWNNEDSPSQEWPYDDEDFYLKEANMHIRWLSWFVPFGTVQYHSLLFEASECYNELTNGCIADLQSFTQKWYDLDLFFVDNKWNVWHHTIMDRNMGASEVYNKKFGLWNVNTWSFWYRYQWWNNYWFKPCYTNWCSDFLEGTGEVTSYHVRDYVYNEGEWYWQNPLPYFAQNVWNDWYAVYDSQVEAIMREENDPPSSIRHQQWQNLRWWVWDTYDGQWNYGEWNWTIVYNNTTRNHSRKWPCPSWYHVPSAKEWDEIFLWWGYAKNKQIDIGGYYGSSIYWTNEWKNFASDLLLPPAWHRKASSLEWRQQWIFGDYRSSSSYENVEAPTYFSSSFVARIFEISSDAISENSREVSSTSQEGLSVRCIKDSPDSELNIYPNGWTNAFISIYKGKIIALWSPKRAWYTFEWWYTNEDFTGEKVEVWDTVDYRIEAWTRGTAIPHLDLYAKRKGNPKCTDLPANATANNSKTPSSDTRYYYSSNSSLVCTFQCNPNYTWNSSTSSCEPTYQCTGTLPANSTKNNNLVPDRNTNYYYSTNASLACTFKCNPNYTWNSSTSSCEANSSTTYQCIGTLPANSTRNNNLTPDRNTSYYYSTDTSLACTFQCDPNYTWSSSTSSCKATIQAYVLTINYKYSDWSTASPTVNEIVLGGDSYSITSPTITNYTASQTIVEWTMPYSHKTIDVVYTKIQNPSGWSSSSSSSSSSSNSTSSSSNSTLEISASPSNPNTYEWIKLTIETDYNYTNKIYFSKLQYKSSSSSSWSNISKTSSTYVSDYSDDWYNWYYRMYKSDYGYVTLKNLVKFKKSGYYKIFVEDTDGNEDYIQISVDEDDEINNSENNSDSNLSLSVNNKYPDTQEPIDVTIKTDNYVGKIKLYAKYKDSSNSWTKISNTSSVYFSDYSNIWEMWYYKLTSSNNWKKSLSDLIEFKKSWTYRIYAEDENWYLNYVQINVYSDNNEETTTNNKTTNSNTTTSANTTNQNTKNSNYNIEDVLSQLLNKEVPQNQQNEKVESNNNIQTQQNTNIQDTSEEIYTSRSCKQYKIQYNSSLWAFTSPNMQKSEYFINKDYLKRYLDSKNPQKANCPVNSWWISTSYNDNSNSSSSFTAPNGKVYSISNQNWKYSSNNLTTNKSFATLAEIKNFIKSRNPLIWMGTKK